MPGFENLDISGIKLIGSGAAPLPNGILESM